MSERERGGIVTRTLLTIFGAGVVATGAAWAYEQQSAAGAWHVAVQCPEGDNVTYVAKDTVSGKGPDPREIGFACIHKSMYEPTILIAPTDIWLLHNPEESARHNADPQVGSVWEATIHFREVMLRRFGGNPHPELQPDPKSPFNRIPVLYVSKPELTINQDFSVTSIDFRLLPKVTP